MQPVQSTNSTPSLPKGFSFAPKPAQPNLSSSVSSLGKKNNTCFSLANLWSCVKDFFCKIFCFCSKKESSQAVVVPTSTSIPISTGGGGGGGRRGGSASVRHGSTTNGTGISPTTYPKGLCGLTNPGNHCWLNSCLQLLFRDESLMKILGKVQDKNFFQAVTRAREKYAEKAEKSQKGPSKANQIVIQALERFWPQIKHKQEVQQQDVQEAWQKMLFEYFPQAKDVNSVDQVPDNEYPDVTPYFYTQTYKDTTQKNRYDYRMSFVVKPGMIIDKNLIENPDDNIKGEFLKAPKHLFLAINRFIQKGKDIGISNESCNLPEKLYVFQNEFMELDYFTLHTGTYNNSVGVGSQEQNSGHYWCCLKQGNQWYEINDSVIMPISKQQALNLARGSLCTLAHYRG